MVRIWKGLEGFGKDLEGFGIRIWKDLEGFGRILEEVGRILKGFERILMDFSRIWEDLEGFGRI